jgi:putative DNA-invertase from lambdoid prophage Rac
VSKDSQDVTHQRLAVPEFALHDKRQIDEFMELGISSRHAPKERQLDVLLARLEPGDTLIVSELSRMGPRSEKSSRRSRLWWKQHIQIVAIKEGIQLDGRRDLRLTRSPEGIGPPSTISSAHGSRDGIAW